MKYDAQHRTLTLEPQDCRTCTHGAGGQGQYTGQKPCEKCKGTGDGPRGGKRQCRECYGSGKRPDFDNPIPCPACGGDFKDAAMESYADRAPTEAIDAMPLFLVLLNRNNTWNENYLGLNCLWSCQDYGRRHEALGRAMNDLNVERGLTLLEAVTIAAQEPLAEIREELRTKGTYASNIVKDRETGALHDALLLCLTRDGYSVRAMSDLPENFRENCIAETEGAPA